MKTKTTRPFPPTASTAVAATFDSLDPQQRDRVSNRARVIWESRGRPAGKDDEIWLTAEQEIIGEMNEGRPRAADS